MNTSAAASGASSGSGSGFCSTFLLADLAAGLAAFCRLGVDFVAAAAFFGVAAFLFGILFVVEGKNVEKTEAGGRREAVNMCRSPLSYLWWFAYLKVKNQ